MINTIINGDCRDVFSKIKEQYDVSLVLTDPPYNINFSKYKDNGDGYKDNLSEEQYVDLISTFKNCPTAIIQYPEEMMRYIVPALGVPDEVLAWCYPSNIAKKFRLINIYGKKPNFKKVIQPYKNLKDKRIQERMRNGEKGAALYDWFSDINLVKNVSKEKTIHPCPIPIALMERLILLLTEENDIVVDPFMGSGTTALACINTNRRFIGIELSKEYCDLANGRISNKEGDII
jgi:site-specific DNA-methyltransferase (adenine-specific)